MSKRRRLLDTSILIANWRRHVAGRGLVGIKETDVLRWAEDIIQTYETNCIVTPVYVEFVAGTTSSHELRLARAFLSKFETVDDGFATKRDWTDAIRQAERVPRQRKRRQLGDCLIAAIAKRLSYEVVTLDEAFPK